MVIARESKWFSILIMLGVTALGFSAGYVGGLSGQQYINYLERFIPSQEQIQKPKSTHTLSIPDLVDHTLPSMVALYRIDEASIKDNAYPLPTKQSYLGDAIAVTADGWIITPSTLFDGPKDKKDTPTRYVAVYKQVVYPLNQIIKDPTGSVAYTKLNGVVLRAASFAWEQGVVGYTTAYPISSSGDIAQLYLHQARYAPVNSIDQYVIHTNSLAKRFEPTRTLSTIGSAVVSDTGSVLGIADRIGIIPVDHFRSSLDQVLADQTIKRINTDITYYDNAWMPFNQNSTTPFMQNGATVIDPGVYVSSLQKGDVVVHVNNENIDMNRSFSDVLNQYKPGTQVKLGVQRDGTVLDIPITLQ